ncbi:hypothetical protein KFU94_56370 [Chloroflexi bacterium TSY]|nr:hypothetical protein [Chloroflexi bacterium TSY]
MNSLSPRYSITHKKDFKKNDTGLEYIGENNQRMGDGGFIMQLTDISSGKVVAITSADWACTVIHEAPLDKACEDESNPVAGTAPCEFSALDEPDGWKAADFDDSSWRSTPFILPAMLAPKTAMQRSSGGQNWKRIIRFSVVLQ